MVQWSNHLKLKPHAPEQKDHESFHERSTLGRNQGAQYSNLTEIDSNRGISCHGEKLHLQRHYSIKNSMSCQPYSLELSYYLPTLSRTIHILGCFALHWTFITVGTRLGGEDEMRQVVITGLGAITPLGIGLFSCSDVVVLRSDLNRRSQVMEKTTKRRLRDQIFQ